MLAEEKIQELKTYYKDELYSETRRQQELDREYIDDDFANKVRHPHKVLKLGLGYEIVNAPADQIVTSNPQAFIEVITGAKDSGGRISKVINGWIERLKRPSPNVFKESVKNFLGRGENYVKFCHNEEWVTSPIGYDKHELPFFDRTGLPVLFPTLDPMVIYGSPEEDINGIPTRVIIFYERQPQEVIVKYPAWKNPKGKEGKRLVEWFEYWDKDTIHLEADGEVVLRIPNPYKFVPFVRKYSGFGRRSPDGELSSLIVSDIKYSRGMIEDVSTCMSDISSVIHLGAHKSKTILAAGEVNEEQIKNLQFGEEIINLLQGLGDLSQFKFEDVKIDPPTQETVQHVGNLMASLTRKHPFILAGFPFGESGRQQGMAESAGKHRYDTVVENTEIEWGTAFEMAFKVMRAIPTMIPEGLQKEDLDTVFRCSVKLKARDPIEEDRLITLGDRLRRQPDAAIDLETFHTDFMGYTPEKSKEISAKILADMVTINNPDWVAVMGMVAAEEGGMERALEAMRQRQQEAGQLGQVPRTTQERTQGEVQTERGREEGTQGTRGGRRPPSRYTRQ